MKNSIYITILLMVTAASCQTNVPLFNGENAFAHLVKQCEFGPRNPGSLDGCSDNYENGWGNCLDPNGQSYLDLKALKNDLKKINVGTVNAYKYMLKDNFGVKK